MDDVKVKIGSPGSVAVSIENRDSRLPYYEGEYAVRPAPYDDITLPTANRSMREDVTVEKIPTYTVSNPSGGNTFIIGGEPWAT